MFRVLFSNKGRSIFKMDGFYSWVLEDAVYDVLLSEDERALRQEVRRFRGER